MTPTLVTLALLLLPRQAEGGAPVVLELPDVELAQQVSVLVGYDSNAKRVPYALPEALTGAEDATAQLPAVVGDSYLQASGALSATAHARGLVLRLEGALGAKLFSDMQRPGLEGAKGYRPTREATRTDEERMMVAEGRALLLGKLPYDIDARLHTRAKLRGQASGARSYAFERSELVFTKALPFDLLARVGLSGQVFHAADVPLFSSFGGGLEGGLGVRLGERETLELGVGALELAYPFARAQPEDDDVRRLDFPLHASLVFTSARRVFVSGGYFLVRNLSNAFAESYTRHRLFGVVGFRLPAEVTVSTRGALQLTQYDEGVSLSRQYFLQEDDESQNSLSLLVTRPFLGGIVLEAQLAWYGNELARGGVKFSRTTAAVGVRAEL